METENTRARRKQGPQACGSQEPRPPAARGLAGGPASHLLLLQRFHERVFQPVGVLGLESLLLVGGHTLLTQNLTALLLLPVRGEVRAALGTNKGFDPQK